MIYEPTVLEMFFRKFAFHFFGKSIYKQFAESLPLGGSEKVLDFGCGMGTVAYYVAKRLTLGHLTCVDTSQRLLAVCRKKLHIYTNITLLQYHMEFPVLWEESYDVIYSHFALHDIRDNDLESILLSLVTCLKAGGVLVFCEPLSDSDKLKTIKQLAERQGLSFKSSRVTDYMVVGNTLESRYIKL